MSMYFHDVLVKASPEDFAQLLEQVVKLELFRHHELVRGVDISTNGALPYCIAPECLDGFRRAQAAYLLEIRELQMVDNPAFKRALAAKLDGRFQAFLTVTTHPKPKGRGRRPGRG